MTASTPDNTPSADVGTALLWLPPELPVLPPDAVDTAEFLAIILEAMTARITADSHPGWRRIGGVPAPGVS